MSNIIPMDFEGHPMRFSDDGWFDATAAADKFNKEPAQWLRLPETVRYIEALKSRYGNITYVKTSRARKDRGGGTWLHPKLAVRFARWLSVDFEIWCDEQIDAIIQGSVHHIDDERIKAIFLLDKCKRPARTVLTGMRYSIGSATRQGSSSLTRLTGQSAMTLRT
ncbi:KilA-N domain-containing protein [Enterobacter cloacae]|uniref:KilA-N domain-containing protein n=1 Tax=Enterobacter cloacae TaxID=550 RepID=UPI0021C20748|nr:KilA-N domain-containing protein [Enterobacter cloacae]UXL11520.1 KilA-N domain-containing protein [Enterobacter cloacae]